MDEDLRQYLDAALQAVHRRLDDQRHLTEREQDKAAESMSYRLQAMDHDRDLLRERVGECVSMTRGQVLEDRIRSLERTVWRLAGGLTLASLLIGIVVALFIKYG